MNIFCIFYYSLACQMIEKAPAIGREGPAGPFASYSLLMKSSQEANRTEGCVFPEKSGDNWGWLSCLCFYHQKASLIIEHVDKNTKAVNLYNH